MRVTIGTLVAGEAARHARGGAFTGARFGYAAALCGVLAAMWAIAVVSGQAAPEELGRYLFMQYRDLQLVLAAVVGPALVAFGCAEDRDGHDLLALTRLTPRQILWTRMATRLMLLGVIDLAAIPLLALLRALGGIGDDELIGAIVAGLPVMVVQSAIAGLLALSSRRALASFLAAMTWGTFAFFLGPSLMVRVPGDPWLVFGPDVARFSPIAAMAGGTSPAWAIAGLIPVIALLDRWGLGERWGRRPAAVAAIVGAALGQDDWPELAWAVGLWGFTALYLDVALWLLGGGDPRPRRSRVVWGDPIAWRAVSTRADGVAAPAWWLTGGWAVALFLIWWQAPLNSARIAAIDPTLGLLVVGVIATTACGVRAIADERDADTLAVLQVTTLPMWRFTAGKLAGIAARTLPLLFVGAVLRDPRLAVWIVPFWAVVALAGMAIAAVAPTSRAAWAAAIALAATYLVMVPVLELVPHGDAIRALIGPPVMTERAVGSGELACGSAGLTALAGALAVAVTRTVR
jgi:hypothetical protein